MLEELLATLPRDQVLKITTEPMAWAEALLVAPSTGEIFRANHIQRQILGSPHRFNVIRVHRRAGKSFSMAVLALFYALMHESCQVLLIAPGGAQVNEIFTTIRDFIRVNPWIEGYVSGSRQSLPQRISFTNGSRISGFTTGARSNTKAVGLRGQGADVVLIDEGAYLHEEDWPAINPIIQGDDHRRWPPKAYIASTPAYTRGHYYELCTNPTHKQYADGGTFWHEVHCSVLANPSVDARFVEECRQMCATELDWCREYLAEFPEIGEGVFPKRMVDASRTRIDYGRMFEQARGEHPGERPATRTIGVDWDKFNKDGRGPNLIVMEAIDAGRYRVVYRQEIPQSEMTLTNATMRLIELNEIWKPEWIYIDRGYGDYQLEELQRYGKQHPRSGLAQKVVGIQFAEGVDFPLPGGGIEKKRFKQAMVQLLRSWFERAKIEIPDDDPVLYKELVEYHIVGQTENNLKFSDTNDHAIAALGLAAMAMHQRVTNPYAPRLATRCYMVKAPIAVPRDELYPASQRTGQGRAFLDPEEITRSRRNSFDRGRLGRSVPGERRSF